ncbi:MAG TPA: NUDIX domain-containing protein [Candidatus Saccharibacteria bacterium]|nr:NUDIX domain-containing protein [Candidatus Saccharibacteria bacterium]
MTARRINVRGIIYKDGNILCQQLTPGADGKVRDYWCTPGGGLDAGESLHQGLTREIVEEIGISPKIGKLLFIQQFEGGSRNQEQLEFFFHIENAEDYQNIDLSITTHGLAEIQDVQFIDPKVHNILPSFLTKIDVKSYVDSTLPVFVDNELN